MSSKLSPMIAQNQPFLIHTVDFWCITYVPSQTLSTAIAFWL